MVHPKKVLFVKLTSLGDLIHALPALTDAQRAYPRIAFDWVVDEHFQEVTTWHPAIAQTFTSNHRKWRKNLLGSVRPIYQLIKGIRKERYDLILDGQGNFKSALITLLAKGTRAGFDRESVREAIAHFAYQKKCRSSWKIHAIDRLRELFAQALDYPLPATAPDFGIIRERLVQPCLELPSPFFVFIPIATWETKLWPEAHWIDLIRKMGLPVLLPWGNAKEKGRADRLAAAAPNAVVLPKLTLSEIGYILTKAKACVSLDTGFSHLAVALKVPTVTIYGATDARLIGTSGEAQIHLQSKRFCSPCNEKKCPYQNGMASPPCTQEILPRDVLEGLEQIFRRKHRVSR